jgi:hypothetical protein
VAMAIVMRYVLFFMVFVVSEACMLP